MKPSNELRLTQFLELYNVNLTSPSKVMLRYNLISGLKLDATEIFIPQNQQMLQVLVLLKSVIVGISAGYCTQYVPQPHIQHILSR